jgi:hypothetical protein
MSKINHPAPGEWWKWKYDLCENEIQCDERTIAFSDNSIFDIEDKHQFNQAVLDMGLRLGWLVNRANAAPELLEALKEAMEAHWKGIPYGAVPRWKALIAKAEGGES